MQKTSLKCLDKFRGICPKMGWDKTVLKTDGTKRDETGTAKYFCAGRDGTGQGRKLQK